MKIFMGLTEIAGYHYRLKMGFQSLNIDCAFIDLSGNKYYYNDQATHFWERLTQTFTNFLIRLPKNKITIIFSKGFKYIWAIPTFLWAITRFNYFIFIYGQSFFPFSLDLPIIKLLRKKIIFIFHGSDSRPPYIDGTHIQPDRIPTGSNLEKRSRHLKKHLCWIEKYADSIICHPLHSHFFEKPIIVLEMIGFPILCKHITVNAHRKQEDGVRILHCPSAKHLKGSTFISETVHQLKQEGYKIDFVEITNQPNSVVISELERCDFVIDQVYSDTSVTGFSIEAASMGKPSIMSGYGWKELNNILSDENIFPIKLCEPNELKSTVIEWLVDEAARVEMGASALEFCQNYFQPDVVALRFSQILRNEITPSWLFDPHKLNYPYGVGVTQEILTMAVKSMISSKGIHSLQLSDKPELAQSFLRLANFSNECESQTTSYK